MTSERTTEYSIMWMKSEAPKDDIDFGILEQLAEEFIFEQIGEEGIGASFEPLTYREQVFRNYALGIVDYLVY